jgi:hypothetical protein
MLARRWAIAIGAFYSTIVILIVGGILATGRLSSADTRSMAANSERKQSLQDRPGKQPGELPAVAQPGADCRSKQSNTLARCVP